MRKVAWGLGGAVGGFFLLGVAGYLLGLLFLAWFGPRDCCGLEGLLPPIVGSVTGTILGVIVGAMTGLLVSRRSPLRLVRLLMLVCGGVALAWLASLVIGPVDIDTTVTPVIFLAVTLLLPVIVWISGAWEKPDTSI